MLATRSLGSRRPVRLSLDPLDTRDLPSVSLLSGALVDAKVAAVVKADVDVDTKAKINLLGIRIGAKADVDLDVKAKVDLSAKVNVCAPKHYNTCHDDRIDLGLKLKVNVEGYHGHNCGPLISAKVGLGVFVRV